jgi:hypothetical protein
VNFAAKMESSTLLQHKWFLVSFTVFLVAVAIIPVYVPISRAFGFVCFFLGIGVLVLVRKFWKSSGTHTGGMQTAGGTAYPKLRENLSSMRTNVKSASSGSLYSREEAAKILREALLDNYLGHGAFPENWITTQNGRDEIEKILKSTNNFDLIDVLEPPAKSHFDRQQYLTKLDRALRLVEEREVTISP